MAAALILAALQNELEQKSFIQSHVINRRLNRDIYAYSRAATQTDTLRVCQSQETAEQTLLGCTTREIETLRN
jgi:hypothetical protein